MPWSTARSLVFSGAVLGALAVSLGAFGAHWLGGAVTRWGLSPDEQSRRLEIWDVGVRYQMYHALALVTVGLLAARRSPRLLPLAGSCFLFGVMVFSGCLYALALTGIRILGAIVPLGGASLIAGWIVLAVAAFPGGGQGPESGGGEAVEAGLSDIG